MLLSATPNTPKYRPQLTLQQAVTNTLSDFSGFVIGKEEWAVKTASMQLHAVQVSALSHVGTQQGQFMFISGLSYASETGFKIKYAEKQPKEDTLKFLLPLNRYLSSCYRSSKTLVSLRCYSYFKMPMMYCQAINPRIQKLRFILVNLEL